VRSLRDQLRQAEAEIAAAEACSPATIEHLLWWADWKTEKYLIEQEILKVLKPFYQDQSATLYHGDARAILPELGRFDLLLTDPPYGLNWTGGTWASREVYDGVEDWDKRVDDAFLAQCRAKADASIIWGGNYYELPPARCWLAWEKTPRFDTLADLEIAWTTLDMPAKSFFENRRADSRGVKRFHPTQKPLSLMQWCLRQVPDAQTVLDPFAGSGTALLAAKRLGRSAVGIEMRLDYCEAAAERLAQSLLFSESEAQAVQAPPAVAQAALFEDHQETPT
jgi:site-specific DNA-methyltransferase (adenine-specific)